MLLADPRVLAAIRWYFRSRYGRCAGPGTEPFYTDVAQVGAFAVQRDSIKAGDDSSIFRLFITLSMYQALRDEVIGRQQRSITRSRARVVADMRFVCREISRHRCPALRSADALDRDCDVSKKNGAIDCGRFPNLQCHVKDATSVFNRMGDMGKLPSSAWLRIWKEGGARGVVADVCREEHSPTKRAELLVDRFASVHRVGRKLATMFVSALSTPTLAPGLTPWFPDVDGNELVVVDTNVAQAVDALRPSGAPRTYEARAAWVRDQAARIDLRELHPDVLSYSPRLVQQALYAFCSKSNRVARGDPCATEPRSCVECAPEICPFSVLVPKPRATKPVPKASRTMKKQAGSESSGDFSTGAPP